MLSLQRMGIFTCCCWESQEAEARVKFDTDMSIELVPFLHPMSPYATHHHTAVEQRAMEWSFVFGVTSHPSSLSFPPFLTSARSRYQDPSCLRT